MKTRETMISRRTFLAGLSAAGSGEFAFEWIRIEDSKAEEEVVKEWRFSE